MCFLKYAGVVLSAAVVCGCEPGLSGDLKIYNESDKTLTAKVVDSSKPDTSLLEIAPNSNQPIKVLSGLGSNNTIDCCPCRLKGLNITSPLGPIKKDPSNKNNWIIPNKDKLKKFGGEPVKCEFHVTPKDI